MKFDQLVDRGLHMLKLSFKCWEGTMMEIATSDYSLSYYLANHEYVFLWYLQVCLVTVSPYSAGQLNSIKNSYPGHLTSYFYFPFLVYFYLSSLILIIVQDYLFSQFHKPFLCVICQCMFKTAIFHIQCLLLLP
jgi:hypothetical protein